MKIFAAVLFESKHSQMQSLVLCRPNLVSLFIDTGCMYTLHQDCDPPTRAVAVAHVLISRSRIPTARLGSELFIIWHNFKIEFLRTAAPLPLNKSFPF